LSLKERIYSVLLVSVAENLNTALSALLPESRYDPIHTVSNKICYRHLQLQGNHCFTYGSCRTSR